MAEGLQEIIQKVLLEGDVEVLKQLGEIGEGGFEAFHEIAEAAESGTSSLSLFATSIALIATALVGVASAVAAFAEAQAEAIQQTNLLAKAFGATTAQITGMEAAFAAAGVSVQTFETFAQRLTTTIAREWPAIAESIRTASTEQASSQEKVIGSTLRVQEAQRALGNVNQETASKISSANNRVEQTFIALQFASQKAFQQIQHDIQSVASASLGLEAAQQRLATLQGRPPSDADKKALEIAQAQLAVDKARQAITDARIAQQQHQAEAALKAAQTEQAHADAQLKRDTLLQESANARQKAELQLREAITSREQAEERANQQALKSIPAIATLVNNLIGGQKASAQAIDITQVKIQDLGKGIIAATSAAGKEPTGLQVMVQLSKLLSSEQGKLLDSAQRLALVQQLGQQRMQAQGASASELLAVLSRGPQIFEKYSSAADKAFGASDTAAHNVEHFKDALTELSFSIDLVNRSLAAAALPIFTHALEAINASLTKQGGLLHAFVSGIEGIGTAIGTAIHWFEELFAAIDKAFNLEKGRTFQVIIGALVVLVAAFATAWLAIPAAIAVVITAIGVLAENWDKIKKVANDTWEAIKNNSVVKWLDGVIEKVKELWEWWKKLGLAKAETTAQQNNTTGAGGGSQAGGVQASANTSAGTGFAGGGSVRGPGTGTSDSIPARLSNGEFVMNAAAVATFGEGFMHAVNNMTFPGFAAGGLVSPGKRPGGGMAPTQPQSVLNLSIDGNNFPGLRGSKNVVDSLAAYAVGRQTSAAGRQPSWKS